AAFHGTWNVLVKVSGDPIATFRRATLVAGVVATIVFVPAWLLLGRPPMDPAAAGFCLVSSLLETLYLWLLSAAFRRGELSAVYPYSGPTWRQAVIIGVFFLAGYVLVLVALSFAPLAIVAPVRETAVVAVAVWGVWRLRERKRSGMKLSGALATLVGVALLAT